MTKKNGMTRLFIVISILWSIAATVLCIDRLSYVRKHPCDVASSYFYHWVDANGNLTDACPARGESEGYRTFEEFSKRSKGLSEKELEENFQPSIHYFPAVFLLLMIIALPLLSLFITYKTIMWVVNGFKTN